MHGSSCVGFTPCFEGGGPLVSNRSFAKPCDIFYRTRTSKIHDDVLRPKPGKIRNSVSYKKAIDLYKDADNAILCRRAILNKLEVELGISQESWVDEVRNFARHHGVLDYEFEDALDNLIGRILIRTIRKPLELTKELLAECLLRVPDARHLQLNMSNDSAHVIARESFSSKVLSVFGQDDKFLISRRLVEESLKKEVALHSLVFVVGNGGSGKSTLAAQFVRSESSSRFSAYITANRVEDDWLGEMFRRWRSPGFYCNLVVEPFSKIIDRMRHANPTIPLPVLLLDLDGIDEIAIEHRHAAKRFIDYFWSMEQLKSPEAVLLVTCRSDGKNHEDAIERLLGDWLDSEVARKLMDSVGKVFVGDFDSDDLVIAARALSSDVEQRFSEDAIAVSDYLESGMETLGSGATP